MDAGEGSWGVPAPGCFSRGGPNLALGPPPPEAGTPGRCWGKFGQLRRCLPLAPGAPLREGWGRAGNRCPAPGRLGGMSPSSVPRPVLPLGTLPAPPATLKFLELGQGDPAGEGGAAGRNGVRRRSREMGSRDGAERASFRELRRPPRPQRGPGPCPREPQAGGAGRGGGELRAAGPELRVGGAPRAARLPPRSRLECPRRRLGCREPEAASKFIYSAAVSPRHRARYLPRRGPGKLRFLLR